MKGCINLTLGSIKTLKRKEVNFSLIKKPITSDITSKVTQYLGVDYVTNTWDDFKEDIKQKAKDKVSNVF